MQQQQRAIRGMAGRCGWAGHAVNPPPGAGPAAGGCAFGRLRSGASQAKRPHPWGLDGALLVCAVLRTQQDRGWASCPTRPRHASGPCGSRPRNRPHPAFDRFPRSVDPRHAWMNLCRIAKFNRGQIRFPTENGSDPKPFPMPSPGPIQPSPGNCRRQGGVGLRGVRGMDAAAKPPGMGLRRPRNPTPPCPTHRQPRAALALALALASSRCRAQPCRPTLPCARKRFH